MFLPRVAAQSNYASALTKTQTDINNSISKVKNWDSSKGSSAALNIQESYSPFYNSVSDLRQSVASITDKEVDSKPSTALIGSIVQSLETLDQKVGDFNEKGIKSISANDISNLEEPTIDIISGIIKLIQTDCVKVNQLRLPLHQLTSAFNSGEKTYGLSTRQFPQLPACVGTPTKELMDELQMTRNDVPAAGKTGHMTVYSTVVDAKRYTTNGTNNKALKPVSTKTPQNITHIQSQHSTGSAPISQVAFTKPTSKPAASAYSEQQLSQRPILTAYSGEVPLLRTIESLGINKTRKANHTITSGVNTSPNMILLSQPFFTNQTSNFIDLTEDSGPKLAENSAMHLLPCSIWLSFAWMAVL